MKIRFDREYESIATGVRLQVIGIDTATGEVFGYFLSRRYEGSSYKQPAINFVQGWKEIKA